MENNFEQYEALLDSASEVAEACLDMEGGEFFLAWAGELLQVLVDKGYCRSACLAAQMLCEVAGIDWAWAGCDELESAEKRAWLNLSVETLMDYVMTATKYFRKVGLIAPSVCRGQGCACTRFNTVR